MYKLVSSIGALLVGSAAAAHERVEAKGQGPQTYTYESYTDHFVNGGGDPTQPTFTLRYIMN